MYSGIYMIICDFMKTGVIALGGNAVIRSGQKGTAKQQFANIGQTCKSLEGIFKTHRLILTHGNGPQVGDILLQQEATKEVPAMPLDVCGAMSQGLLGYMLQQQLRFIAGEKVVTVVTQVVVDKKDHAFKNPTKFVGPSYNKKKSGMVMRKQAGKWRRVVPSPLPLDIIEKDQIKNLVNKGFVVIACGGGGIPVIKEKGKLHGVEAVIDKDLAAEKLATLTKANELIMLTNVPYAYLNYRKKNKTPLKKIKLRDVKKYYKEGHFPPGDMGPKIEAGIKFLEHGGEKVIITTPNFIEKALDGEKGTIITK